MQSGKYGAQRDSNGLGMRSQGEKKLLKIKLQPERSRKMEVICTINQETQLFHWAVSWLTAL